MSRSVDHVLILAMMCFSLACATPGPHVTAPADARAERILYVDGRAGDPKAIAAAEKKASDARYRAEQAEAVAVKSGNPGAAARAKQAHADASAAEQELAKLQCKGASARTATP